MRPDAKIGLHKSTVRGDAPRLAAFARRGSSTHDRTHVSQNRRDMGHPTFIFRALPALFCRSYITIFPYGRSHASSSFAFLGLAVMTLLYIPCCHDDVF